MAQMTSSNASSAATSFLQQYFRMIAAGGQNLAIPFDANAQLLRNGNTNDELAQGSSAPTADGGKIANVAIGGLKRELKEEDGNSKDADEQPKCKIGRFEWEERNINIIIGR